MPHIHEQQHCLWRADRWHNENENGVGVRQKHVVDGKIYTTRNGKNILVNGNDVIVAEQHFRR